MLITLNELGRMAASFLEVLSKSGIDTTPKVDVHLGEKIPALPTQDYLEFSLGDSNEGTKAYRIEYVSQGIGTPLTLRINPDLNYARIILKAGEILPGYMLFAKDEFGNFVQDKRIASAILKDSLKEIELLRKLSSK